jgi:uncharacterized membrane protein
MTLTAARAAPPPHRSRLGLILLAVFCASMAARGQGETTLTLMAASLSMFACCWVSAAHLLGARSALRFVLIATLIGWFAEQMGSSHGWFFGHYHYTEVLGPRLGNVPLVIPMMWFALTYVGYVMANLIVWQAPVAGHGSWGDAVLLTLLASMIATAFDLGADPYFVYKLHAWVMAKTDGAWFGETVQGFFGWVSVSFVIVAGFRWSTRQAPPTPSPSLAPRHVLVPLALYACGMVFQMVHGTPVEVRSMAPFAMGIPLVCALAGLQRWRKATLPSPREAEA